jgi:hypothetical protein
MAYCWPGDISFAHNDSRVSAVAEVPTLAHTALGDRRGGEGGVAVWRGSPTRKSAAARIVRTMAGPFAWAYFLAWQDTWGSALSRREFAIDGVTPREEAGSSTIATPAWRRNLKLKGAGRVLTKTNMLTMRLDAVLRRYPDCQLASGLENGYEVWNRTKVGDQHRWLSSIENRMSLPRNMLA